jgi:hypothetical protein
MSQPAKQTLSLYCPRCNERWYNQDNYYCVICDLQYDPISYRLTKHFNGYILTWLINKKQCYLAKMGYQFSGEFMRLPWLPFDISFIKLKLYLTFQ